MYRRTPHISGTHFCPKCTGTVPLHFVSVGVLGLVLHVAVAALLHGRRVLLLLELLVVGAQFAAAKTIHPGTKNGTTNIKMRTLACPG